MKKFSISPEVIRAINSNHGVVALESTVIAHGLPFPENLEAAASCEAAVAASGATAATIGIIEGQPVIGLSDQQIRSIAEKKDVLKVNIANLADVVASGRWGATTVAASLHIAQMAGISVFSTGGIGGVHRNVHETWDISSDLTALAKYSIVTVCAGAKSILDLPKTLEKLETMGVPIIGYRTSELPAFYSRSSGLELDLRADEPNQVAELVRAHWGLGFKTAVVVVVPVPEEDEIPRDEMEEVINKAQEVAENQKITGKALTPFLLSYIVAATEGRALKANISLLRNNAGAAGEIACALAAEGG